MTQDKILDSSLSRFVGGVIRIVPPIGALIALAGFVLAVVLKESNPDLVDPLGAPAVKWLIFSGLALIFLATAGVIALAVVATLLLVLALVVMGIVTLCGLALDHLLLMAERHVLYRRKR